MHVVNMKAVHPNLTAALDDPTGLAVLGVFFDVCSYLFIFNSGIIFFFGQKHSHSFSCLSPLQVVYAENVHFAHISQKLSSVAYRGWSGQQIKLNLFDLMIVCRFVDVGLWGLSVNLGSHG